MPEIRLGTHVGCGGSVWIATRERPRRERCTKCGQEVEESEIVLENPSVHTTVERLREERFTSE